MASIPKIPTCFHFQGNAEEAVRHYVELFPDSKLHSIARYGENAPLPEGTPMFLCFELNGVPFRAINGVADWPFTEAMSLMVYCEDQAELDRIWDGLLAGGGAPMACGWLQDRFGVRWQVVPRRIEELLSQEDEAARQRVMQALWNMVKLDIAELEAAANAAG